jgi:hypothetical protein
LLTCGPSTKAVHVEGTVFVVEETVVVVSVVVGPQSVTRVQPPESGPAAWSSSRELLQNRQPMPSQL